MPQDLTRADLAEIARDPSLTEADATHFSPREWAAIQKLRGEGDRGGAGRSTVDALQGVLTGAAKGAGETVFNLGDLVHNTPGVGSVTDALSRVFGGDPEATFDRGEAVNPLALMAGADDISTEAKTGAERVGKFGEQVGEFMVPAGATRLATIRKLTQAIPDTLSPKAMAAANKLTSLVGRVLGEGASATGVAAIHGDKTPESAGAIAGGTTAAGEALSRTMTALMKTPMGRELLPYLTAIAASQIVPFNMPGLAAVAGGFGLTRSMARRGFANPKVRAQVGKKITQGSRRVGQAAAGAYTESETDR